MNLVMQEGEIQDMPPTPPNFPMCNNFRFNSNHFFTSLRNNEKRLASKGPGYALDLATPRNAAQTCLMFPWMCHN